MIDWIEVPIYCNTNKTSQLKDLGIEIDDKDFEVRMGSLRKSLITGYYPTSNNETTVCHNISGESFEINLTYEQFKNLML